MRYIHCRGVLVAVALILGLSLLGTPPPRASAATITVNSLLDTATAGDGACTLREAINNANTDSDTTSGDCLAGLNADIITFSVSGTIALGSTLPDIASGMSIGGLGQITLNGQNAVRIMQITTSEAVSIGQLTFINGNSTGSDGGAIRAAPGSQVWVFNNTFSNNSGSIGGAISNEGTMTIYYCSFSGNSSTLGNGGAVQGNGPTTIKASTFSGNSANNIGGAVRTTQPVTLTYNTFYGNSAGSGGGNFSTNNTAHLAGNLFAGPLVGGNCSGGTLNDNGYNFADDATCGFTQPTSANNATLPFDPLTMGAHAPSTGSDAIGAIPFGTNVNNNGEPMVCDNSDQDQLFNPRPIIGGTACTSGALEIASPTCIDPLNIPDEAQLALCITEANNNGPGLDSLGLAADITLTTPLPTIDTIVSLDGNGFSLDGGGSVRILEVTSSGNFSLTDITIQNGSATDGAGIFNAGLLGVSFSTFTGNVASVSGGAIAGDVGSATVISDSTFTNNGPSVGGAIDAIGGTLYVSTSTFDNNTSNTNGAAIYLSTVTATITNNTFVGNDAGSSGGAVSLVGGSTAIITNNTFSGNTAQINGGAIRHFNGTVTLTHNTFSNNSAPTGNSIWLVDTLFAAGNLIETSAAGANCVITGTLTDNGYNLADDASCAFTGTGSIQNATVPLDPLSGGVHAPSAGNQAIGLIPNGTVFSNNGVTLACNGTTFDQLGAPRPINVGDNCTSGAMEVPPPACIDPLNIPDEAQLALCITEANNNGAGLDTLGLAADITLTTPLPTIDTAIALNGNGFFVDGDNSVQVFEVTATGNFALNGITVQNGNAGAANGGGILNSGGIVTLNSTTLTGNRTAGGSGGGIYSAGGNVTLTNVSQLLNNSASGGDGGGVAVVNGLLTIDGNSLLSNNNTQLVNDDGGGVYAENSTVIIDTATIDSNFALASAGGGVYVNGGSVSINNVTLLANTAPFGTGGAITVTGSGSLTVSNSHLLDSSGGGGGAIYNDNSGTVTITRSTFFNNTAGGSGGAIVNYNTLTITNSTFSGNTANGPEGGAIAHILGTLTLTHSTFTNNTTVGVGDSFSFTGTAHLTGNILADGGANNCASIGGILIDNGYNLSNDATCGLGGIGSVNGATLPLSALSGGAPGQQVHTPQAGNQAIGAIPNGTSINNNGVTLACNGSTTDQLGANRPINAGEACTSGSVEVVPPAAGVIGAAKQMSGNCAIAPTLTLTFTFENLGSTPIDNLSALDDLTAVLGVHGVDWTFSSITSAPLSLHNPAYNGHSVTELFAAGQSLPAFNLGTITVQVQVLTSGTFNNQITVNGTVGAIPISDISHDGLDPDPNGDDNPDEMTVSTFACALPGITITQLEAPMQTNEAGDTAQFSVVLNSAPLQPVTINVVSDTPAEGQVTAGAVLNFDNTNWNIAQTVTVTGQDDAVVDGDIAYNADWSSTSADAAYDGQAGNVPITNLDDDAVGITITELEAPMQTSEAGDTAQFSVVLNSAPTNPVTITVVSDTPAEGQVTAGAVLNFDAGNWNIAQTVTLTGQDDAVVDGNIAYNADWSSSSLDAAYDLQAGSVPITNLDDDAAGITITELEAPMQTSEAGDTAQFSVVLNSAPTNPVTINVVSDTPAEGQVTAGAVLNFDNTNWNIAQTVTVTGQDDAVVDGDIAYNADWSSSSLDAAYDLQAGSVAITNLDDDAAGITITELEAPMQTDEAGDTAQFSVVLNSAPTNPVTITVVSDTPAEGQVTAGAVLNFDNTNWNIAQTVTVTGQDDAVVDGDIAYNADWSATSADAAYNGQAGSVAITNLDNDTAGIAWVAINPFEVDEQGATSTNFFVLLNSQPTAAVSIDVTNSDGQCTVAPATLNFDDTNWNQLQEVIVTAVDDAVVEGTHACDIDLLSASTDPLYDALGEVLTFTVFDNDTPAIILTPDAYTTWEEGQPTTTYTVELSASPAVGETVTVDIELIPLQLASQTPVQVVFTDANWNIAVEIEVVPLEDGLAEFFTIETITHTATSDLLGSAWEGVTADLLLSIYDEAAQALPPAFNIPNNGEIMISLAQTQQPYDSAGGEPIYLPTGAPLLLPHDYDGNGFDTYTVTEIRTVAGELWFGIFIGNATWVWVPADGVTILR